MKKIAVLGATGSVGTQALEIAKMDGHRVELLSAGRNVSRMEDAVREFRPKTAVMADPDAARDLAARLSDTDCRVLAGDEALLSAVAETDADVIVNSILGAAGLNPTLAAVDAGKRIALSNKECLVIAGDILNRTLASSRAQIIPVDSEHSAIFQCLKAGKKEEVKRLLLTASGGPFRGFTKAQLADVTLAKTLAHPTWKMGKKITVDSATLMNKGFEVIEATHLFGVPAARVEVVVHPESIIHSAVEYIDNTVIAELSVPDMRMCVAYAIDYPERTLTKLEPLDLFRVGKLTFERPDTEAFPLLSLAMRAAEDGGGMGAVMNAADEIAVDAFLSGKISYTKIADVVLQTYEKCASYKYAPTLDDRFAADSEARAVARALL